MKKLAIAAAVLTALTAFVGCGLKSQPVPFDNGDSIDVILADSTVYGTCMEGTAMNTLQILTDAGDTLTLDISEAQEAGQVLGGLQVGDRMAVIPSPDGRSARKVINQGALLGSWVIPNPLDGSDEVGFAIKEGGILEDINQSSVSYRTWRLHKGQLEMVAVRLGGVEDEEVAYYDLLAILPDTLVIRLHNDKTEAYLETSGADETYRYSRQKPRELYGQEVQLEEVEDFGI